MIFGESSERKKLERQMRAEGRLPPGQSLTLKWPVLHYGNVPRIDLSTWDFRIDGLVEEAGAAHLGGIQQAPQTRNSLRHSLRHALEPLRQSLRGRAVHGSHETRHAQAGSAFRAWCAANTDSRPICRSKT